MTGHLLKIGRAEKPSRECESGVAAMKAFLDASILLEACLAQSPGFEAADALVTAGDSCTSAHALAEAYATLSGDRRLNINPHDASQMVGDLADFLEIGILDEPSLLTLIRNSPAQGVFGGTFYDAIHAETARQMKCDKIFTLNQRHFRHVAPDLHVAGL